MKIKILGYDFCDCSLIKRAFTHSSFDDNNYERLEFLGDSILDFVVGEYFYKNCQVGEGKLTVMRSYYVSENYLASLFDRLKLSKYVILGKSWQGEISRAVKADIIEAIIGAVYLDGGLESAKNFIYNNFKLEDYKEMKDENYKSKLQELVQGNFKCKMSYVTVASEKGGFISKFFMDEDEISEGEGSTKQEAEQSAAQRAIDKLFLING